MSHQAEPELVRERADIERLDGEVATVVGRYEAIAAPTKGLPDPSAERDRAWVVLDDGLQVYLEAMDDPRAQRPAEELDRLDGQEVRATGVLHRYMPAEGASLISPCVTDIERIDAEGARDDGS